MRIRKHQLNNPGSITESHCVIEDALHMNDHSKQIKFCYTNINKGTDFEGTPRKLGAHNESTNIGGKHAFKLSIVYNSVSKSANLLQNLFSITNIHLIIYFLFISAQPIRSRAKVSGPVTCEICGKTSSCYSHYVTHKRVHTGEKPFKCKICGKEFAQKSNMFKHMVTHQDFL